MAYIESGPLKDFSTMARSFVDGSGGSGGCNLLEPFRFFILTKRAVCYRSLMSIVSLTSLEEKHIYMPSATSMPTLRGLLSLHKTFGCENSPQTGAPLLAQKCTKCTKSSVPSWDAAPIPPVLVNATWPPWRFMYATMKALWAFGRNALSARCTTNPFWMHLSSQFSTWKPGPSPWPSDKYSALFKVQRQSVSLRAGSAWKWPRQIDLRHHIKFNADENKFVKDKLRMNLQCLKVVVLFFFGKVFCQLNNRYVVKKQYNPLNIL